MTPEQWDRREMRLASVFRFFLSCLQWSAFGTVATFVYQCFQWLKTGSMPSYSIVSINPLLREYHLTWVGADWIFHELIKVHMGFACIIASLGMMLAVFWYAELTSTPRPKK